MIISTIAHARKILLNWRNIEWLTQDTETKPKTKWAKNKDSTLIHHRHKIFIFSVCYRGVAYSFPTDDINPRYPSISEWAELFNWYFRDINPNVLHVFHNANYDLRVMRDMGWDVQNNIWDTMFGCWMADANKDKALKARAPYLGRYLRDTKTINFNDLQQLADYAEMDVIATDELAQMHLKGEIVRSKTLKFLDSTGKVVEARNIVGEFRKVVEHEKLTEFDRTFVRTQELQVLKATLRCQNNGMPFDSSGILTIRKQMEEDLAKHKKAIFKMAGKVFNINATKQKIEVLQDLGVTITKTTKKGAPSLNAESILDLKGTHPIIDHLYEYGKIAKLQSVYIGENGLSYYVNPKTGRIHPSLNPIGAVTGRFTCSSPNAQQIPSRNDRYKVKGVFRAPKGKKIICLDFSQIELRMMAMMSEDPKMMAVLNDLEGDIHQETSDGLEVPRDPVAKACNFLIIFKGGPKALQFGLKMAGHNASVDDCQLFIDKFDSHYARVPEFREELYAFHREKGFVPLLTGRRRSIENMSSSNKWKVHQAETQCINNVIQGSAQDLCKNVIVRCDPNRINIDRVVSELPESAFASLQIHPKVSLYPDRKHRLLLKHYSERVVKLRRVFRLGSLEWINQVHDEVLFVADEGAAHECAAGIAEIMSFLPAWKSVYSTNVWIKGDGGVGDSWAEAKKPKDAKDKFVSPFSIWN